MLTIFTKVKELSPEGEGGGRKLYLGYLSRGAATPHYKLSVPPYV